MKTISTLPERSQIAVPFPTTTTFSQSHQAYVTKTNDAFFEGAI